MKYRLQVHTKSPWEGEVTKGFVNLQVGDNYEAMDKAFDDEVKARKKMAGGRLYLCRFQLLAEDGTALRISQLERCRLGL